MNIMTKRFRSLISIKYDKYKVNYITVRMLKSKYMKKTLKADKVKRHNNFKVATEGRMAFLSRKSEAGDTK